MSIPLVILCGAAGSGKDEIATQLVRHHGAVAVGQADPLKWIARDIFGFSPETLFGPSAARNALDPTWANLAKLDEARFQLEGVAPNWAKQLFQRYRLAAEARDDLLHRWWPTVVQRAREAGGLTARWVLQTLGTEWGRGVHSEVWIDQADLHAFEALNGRCIYTREHGLVSHAHPVGWTPPRMAVITDGRFRNEILGIRRRGGLAVKVERPNQAPTGAAVAAAGVAGHASEAELATVPDHFYDGIACNNGDLEDLRRLAGKIAGRVEAAPWFLWARR